MKKIVFTVIASLFFAFNCFPEEYDLTVVFNNSSKNKDFFEKAIRANGFYLKEQFISMTLSWPEVKSPRMAYVYDIRVKSDNIDELVRELEKTGCFEEIVLHEIISACCPNPYPINDAKIVNGTFNNYAIELINARCAWNITQGNPNIVIAIADMEFEKTHEDLSSQIIYLSGQTSGGNHHGTMVAGAAAAATNNNKGVCGVGYNSKIAAYRIPHTSGGTASSGDIRNAIKNAYLDGRRIINVSWAGSRLSKTEAEEITGNGTVLTLSAGNTPDPPFSHSTIANVPGVIVVSAVDKNNNYYTSFARNQYVDLCAPGVYVAVPINNNDYQYISGTSISAPLVAGTIALMLSVNPNLTPAEIETILKNTAAPINNAYLYPGLTGAGRLDTYAAVRAAQIAACPIPVVNVTGQITNNRSEKNNCGDIQVQNAKVRTPAKLTLDAAGEVNIIDFEMELGAELEIK